MKVATPKAKPAAVKVNRKVERKVEFEEDAVRICIKILHFDSRDTIVITKVFHQVQSFISELHLTYGLTTSDIMAALQAAHQAADEYGIQKLGTQPSSYRKQPSTQT